MYALGQLPSVDSVGDSIDAAVAYLRSRWNDFAALGPRLVDLQHRAAVAAGRAREAGDLERYELARGVIRAVGELNVRHGQAVDTMRTVARYVGIGGGLGALGLAIPAAQVTVITSLALLVAWFFRAYAAESRKLDLIEAGVLTPEQAAALDPGGAPGGVLGQLNQTARLALYAVVALVGYRLLESSGVLSSSKRKRRTRRNPPLVVFESNPPQDEPEAFGEEVYAVWYRHADDGVNYVHDFEPGVELLAYGDGTVGLAHRRGRRVWEDR